MSVSMRKFNSFTLAMVGLAGSALAASAPAYALLGQQGHHQPRTIMICDNNGAAWYDRWNASDESPTLEMTYRQAHRSACHAKR